MLAAAGRRLEEREARLREQASIRQARRRAKETLEQREKRQERDKNAHAESRAKKAEYQKCIMHHRTPKDVLQLVLNRLRVLDAATPREAGEQGQQHSIA
eukprot:g72956.t1